MRPTRRHDPHDDGEGEEEEEEEEDKNVSSRRSPNGHRQDYDHLDYRFSGDAVYDPANNSEGPASEATVVRRRTPRKASNPSCAAIEPPPKTLVYS